eukprot:CAMPEP_0168423598 /NCGR_PEP_ID=MMETSP0228-20121227/34392_1 /TAXON_ID=133427 /ORGANISM="Protoceratium reticulatum, Strain CCCM 535 (=CCMP 1889)" /LENGTH=82 /DNA_ID=CAMNT_0008437567 /DNA_START=56 /DNA_END=304 /DNA_ORIENTATION=-
MAQCKSGEYSLAIGPHVDTVARCELIGIHPLRLLLELVVVGGGSGLGEELLELADPIVIDIVEDVKLSDCLSQGWSSGGNVR